MTPPTWPLVPAQVQQWVEDVCVASERVDRGEFYRRLPEELARLHDQFERVHPFIDGNGRAGRLVMNLVLVRLGYPPVIIFKRQRDAYLTAMRLVKSRGRALQRMDRSGLAARQCPPC